MTTFFIIASIGYAFMAAVAILDKSILSKSLGVSSYAFYSTVFFLGAFLLLPFSETISIGAFVWALISGLGFGFATWAMFLGLRRGEAAHIVPFIGAVTAVGVFILSSIFIGESFSSMQMAGITLLIVASFLFSYEKNNGKGTPRHAGFGWALLSGFLFAISHVAAKHFYGDYSFITGLAWTKGLVGIAALFAFFGMKSEESPLAENISGSTSGKSTSLWLVLVDKVLAIAGTLAIQYAIAIGSVAVVSGLVGLQYALILLFAFVSTMFAPRFFSEHFTRKEVVFEILAIILVIVGIFLLI